MPDNDSLRQLCKGSVIVEIGGLPSPLPASLRSPLASRQALLCLLDNGSDVNAHDIAGNTALHHCACADPGIAQSEALVFMALLLITSYGADVNARNCAGRQALVNCW